MPVTSMSYRGDHWPTTLGSPDTFDPPDLRRRVSRQPPRLAARAQMLEGVGAPQDLRLDAQELGLGHPGPCEAAVPRGRGNRGQPTRQYRDREASYRHPTEGHPATLLPHAARVADAHTIAKSSQG